jgi:calmodulin
MEKSPATAACHHEPIFQEELGILILFTILTWSISKLQRFFPSSFQSCSCPVSNTTSTPVLANTEISKALNNNEHNEVDKMQSDAEIAMRKMGFSFDQEHSVALNAISSECISTLFVDEEPSLQEVKMAFLLFDENNDGYIDASDLQRVFRDLGLGEGVGLSECEQMISRYDMNEDTRIDFIEFTNVLEASFC